MTAARAAIERWGGILVQPRATIQRLAAESGAPARSGAPPRTGRFDWWWLAGLFVLGSQIEHLTQTVARYQAFRSFWLLVNGLALALLTPLLVGLLVEGIVGAARSRYRHLPLVALVLVATVANLLRQQGLVLPGPRYLPEIAGTVWAAGLAVWIRKTAPVDPPGGAPDAAELAETREEAPEVTHD